MTIKLILKDPSRLSLVFKAMHSMMDETNIKITDLGLNIRGMSTDHVCLTDTFIVKEAFQDYPKLKGESIEFRINLDNIIKILGRSKPADTLEIELTERTLNLIINSTYKKTFQMSMQAFNKEEDKLPKIPYSTTLQASPAILHEIIGDTKLVSEFMTIVIKNKKLTVNGRGRDQNAGSTLDFWDEEAKVLEVIQNDEDIPKLDFSFSMFESVVNTLKNLQDPIVMDMGAGKPMRLGFNIKDFGKLHHYIAPVQRGD